MRLQMDADISPSTREQYRQALHKDVYEAIGHVPAKEVTADMVAWTLDEIEGRGALVHADRVRSAIGSTFKWAVKRRRGDVLTDPTVGLGKRAPSIARARVLDDTELAILWNGIGDPSSPLSESMQLIVKLAILTGQRRAEVCGATRTELTLDNTNPVWTIPGDKKQDGKIIPGRMKNRLEHVVPLSTQSVELWRKAIQLAGEAEYVFPARGNRKSIQEAGCLHIRPHSVSQAMRRLSAAVAVEDVHLHDMRRSIATWCGDNGVRPDVIERILSHKPRDVTRRHYNFAGMDELVRDALQAWADHIWSLVLAKQSPLKKTSSMASRQLSVLLD